MKHNPLRKGFTLVEIMIVVVIIGILATLAVPALKKARNSAIEKSLFNDARQISSAANQFFADRNVTSTTLSALVGANNYIASLSNGTLIRAGNGSTTALTAATNLWSLAGSTSTGLGTVLNASNDAATANSLVQLGNAGYDAGLSGNAQIITTTQGGYAAKDNYLAFSVDTGALLKKGAKVSTDTAAY